MANVQRSPAITIRRIDHQVVWHKIVGRIAWLIVGLTALFYRAP